MKQKYDPADVDILRDLFEPVLDEITLPCNSIDCGEPTLGAVLSDEGIRCPTCYKPFHINCVEGAIYPIHFAGGGPDHGYLEIVLNPELPTARRKRFQEEHGIGEEMAWKVTSSREIADLYESLGEQTDYGLAASFVADTLVGELHHRDRTVEGLEADKMSDTLNALLDDEITSKVVTQLLRTALDEGRSLDEVYQEEDVGKTDSTELEEIVSEVMEAEQEAVEDYLGGEENAINHIIGQVMGRTQGQADPQEVRELIASKLDG